MSVQLIQITLSEELNVWKDKYESSRSSQEKKDVRAIYELIDSIIKELKTLNTWSSGSDVVTVVSEFLDDLWKVGEVQYPQTKIIQLMDAIAFEIVIIICDEFRGINIFDPSISNLDQIVALLQWGSALCVRYEDARRNLVKVLWSNSSDRQVDSPSYSETTIAKHFATRLDEILLVRNVHRQLLFLLSMEECDCLRPTVCFIPFAGINPIDYDESTNTIWREAISRFEKAIAPAEKLISGKLQARLNPDFNVLSLLQEYKRYRELIKRPNLSNHLRSYREQFLLALINLTGNMKNDIENKDYSKSIVGNISEAVLAIYNAKQISHKVKDIGSVANICLQDLPNYMTLLELFQDVAQAVKQFEKKCFRNWVDTTSRAIRTNELTLKTDANVIEFTEGLRLMEVTYNPKLTNLIEEAQELSVLGFRIPSEISTLVTTAKKFIKFARELDQIANFHNTIGDRMITSQRPMMLETAVALSKMVQKQEGITWTNIGEVHSYIDNLKHLVLTLSRQNTRLTFLHNQMKAKVSSLFEIDLVKQQSRWKDVLKEIRNIFKQVELQGFKNTRSWQNHWEHQLYKALEVQYVMGIASLNENLPPIEVELVYRQQKLQFKPPLEEVRMKYYANVKKFLSIPMFFRGLSDENSEDLIYAVLIDRHSYRFQKIYDEGEACLEKVAAVKYRFEEWVALGDADIDLLSKHLLKTWEDWDLNFRVSKNKGQEIARLPCADEHIGCFVVTFGLLRLEIELLNRKYWEILSTLLYNSIFGEMATAEAFLTESIAKLKQDPKSVQEISMANALKENLIKELPRIRLLLESLDKKNKTLSTWTKERHDVTRTKVLWENFLSMMENHHALIGRQVESIKMNLKTQIQSVNHDLEHFKLRWDELKPKDADVMLNKEKFEATIQFMNEKRAEWTDISERLKYLKESCENIQMDNPKFPLLEDIEKDLASFEEMWSKIEEFQNGLKEFEQEDWIIFRAKPYRFEEYLQLWAEKFRAQPKSDFVVRALKDIESYKSIIPNLRLIRGDTFSEKHWFEMFSLLGMQNKPLAVLKVSDFLEAREKINEHAKDLKELNTRAAGEITVRQALSELDAWEVEAKFILSETKDSQNRVTFIIQDFKTVLNKLGDNQSLLQSIRTSPYYSHFADRITMWESRLSDLDEYLQNLNKIQRRWVYLEPIFSHGVLDSEQQRFKRIDDDFRNIMTTISKDSRVICLCKLQGIRNRLNVLLDQLSRCQSSLNEFLEKKRSGFPRFYFLGDDDLLEILGQSTKPSVIQSHLKKLFAGIHNVDFDSELSHIITMKSLEGEIVPLKSKVKITPNVEEWLSELSNEMKYTLKSSLLDCVSDTKHDIRNPDKYPSQILSLCNSIVFTDRCEEAIRSGKLPELLNQLKEELDTYTNVSIGESHPSPVVMELKLKELILDVIHEIDVVEFLIGRKARNVNEWNWQKQLRFYIKEDGSATVKMADAEFSYSYEYQGNAQKLVHTPLTDKCYLTLTQGMRMGLGGNPYGPAGTGKTESVKALGGLLGRQVLVFNCDEGIDVKAMGRIFVGLCQVGAFGVFDEFNRLEAATLSAVSMQIQPIQSALKQKASSVILMGETVPLDTNAGIFVTMNPAGKLYGGRNKLPDNLKQLFRPVVMSQPDNELIAEVILFTEGFKSAKKIGRKLVEIFKLSSKLLSPQTHYDWGLRALKTVLKGCGTSLKEVKKTKKELQEIDESDTVVSALRLNTLPKLTYLDCFRFDALIKDVFSNATFKDLGYNELADKVREVYPHLGLQVNENQVRKCLELYEQLQQRMGVVIVGPPGSGKSTICHLLKHALLKLGMHVKSHVMNPKAMPRSYLLGHINLDTRQWTDGILTMKAQQVYSEPPDVTSWIVCDGDIDPEWVESLNSVLDDNRLLTLPSGWRIKFGPNVNFVFETHDLSYASPATISRMGMIFLSEEDADIKGVIAAWVAKEEPDNQSHLSQMINDYFYQALQWTVSQTDVVVPLPTVSITKNVISQLRGATSLSQLAVGMIQGFGGHLAEKIRLILIKQILTSTQQPISSQNGTVLNLYYDSSSDRVEFYEDEDLNGVDEFNYHCPPLVMTADVKRVLNHLKPWLEDQQSFILIGPEGCGKTMILEYAFSELRSTDVATIHCSSLISPENVIQKLSQMCITMTTTNGRVYKSKDGERLILYFKDINLVKPDKFGTCQLVEFLQQIVSYNGFYDQNLEWVGVQGIQIVASITTGSTGGRHNLSPRFLASIRVCTTNQPEQPQLITIYKNYFSLLLKTKYPEHKLNNNAKFSGQLARCMVIAFEEIRSTFTQVMHSHYQFTPRDLTKWIFGIVRYDLAVLEFSEELDIIQAWAAESYRLFSDKLVSTEDKEKFDSIIQSTLINEWGVKDMNTKMAGSHWISGLSVSTTMPRPELIIESSLGPTMYKQDVESVVEIVEKGMMTFARETRELNVVLFRKLLENVVHFDRILSFPCSSMVLAGRAGIGRRSALSIVSALHRASLFTLKVGRNYSLKAFKVDLKAAIQLSAVEGNRVFLVVEDYQLINVIFLDMINSLLSSGEIPGLYSSEELENIISSLREVAASEGYPLSLYSYFATRVKRLMQIILIMDHTSESFTVNCESNPAIYKLCNLVWLDNWAPDNTTAKVIIKTFYDVDDNKVDDGLAVAGGNIDEQIVVNGFEYIYSTLDEKLSYPRRYYTFVHTYANLFLQKRQKILEQTSRLKAGVSKLIEAKDIVEKLKAEASVQEVTLAEKQAEANNALELITDTMRNANVQRGEMEDLREKTLHENEILLAKKGSIDEELKEIEPLVQTARSSVGNIKSEAISEIRSLRAPPDVIRDILEGVLQLMGIRDMSWNNMKTFLSKRGIKDEIKTFDARTIRSEDRDSVEKLLKTKGESFEMKNAKRASAAAAPLAEWVVANVKYSRVLEKIEPLEKQQQLLERNLKLAEGQIGKLSSELVDVDQRVQELKSRLNQYTKEAAEIEFHLSKAKETLVAAEGLVGKLLDEFTRWNMELQELSRKLGELPMYTLVAAAFMTYLCNATETLRQKYLQQWSNTFRIEKFDFCSFLSTERDTLQWQALGLPTDLLSRENAIIVMNLMNGKVGTCLRPYLIDPSGRATEWLKNVLTTERITPTVISLQDAKFPTELELAIRFGKILIIMEADTVEPILIPVLRGNLVSQGSRETVQIGDKQVDYNPDFRLYLSTRNPNPILSPDAASVLTVVNFTTTKAGLTSQLLTTTLSHEKPEIETKKNELVKNVESLKIQLDKLEETLLHELASAQGNILENKELLLSLNQTKANSMAITQSLAESSVLQTALDNETNVYLTLANFGSQLYFSILDASKLNNMYQFSLSSFIYLFKKNLKLPSRGGSTDSRISTLMKDLEKFVYEYVCRSLFKSDRLAFAMYLGREMHGTLFQPDEWESFVGTLVMGAKGDAAEGSKSSVPSWVSEDRNVLVHGFSTTFPNLYEQINLNDENLWKDFYDSVECEDKIPKEIHESITPFENLMVIQILRPDRLLTAMTNFSRYALGRKSLFPPPASLRHVLLDTRAEEPILILISSGADPSQELKELAQQSVGADKYFEISMGHGQSEIAVEKLRSAAEVGTWICMKNLHLVTHWLDTLEKEIQSLNPHENFRLWLTSEPHHLFPNILAQSCLKIAYEAPQGLKKNLQRTYGNWSKDYLMGDKNILRTQSLFVLAFFHAVVQERRTYIPQGWSKFYEFNESDLRAGADVLDQMFKGSRSKEIQWSYVHGLFENAIYGGRVDNIYDNRVLVSYLHDFFNDSVLTGANPSSRTVGPSLRVPSTTNLQDYIDLIDSVPEFDKPSSFGLPSNIERSWQRITSTHVLNQLKTLSRSFNDIDTFDRKLWHQELSPVLNMWKKINQGRGAVELLQKKVQPPSLDGENKSSDPIVAFVLLENYNSLIFLQSVHRKLGEISKTIRGVMIPTSETVEVADSLMKHETPPKWLKIWEGPLESTAYLQGIVMRATAIQRWTEETKNGSLLSNPLDLSELFNPDTFLSAFKQYCARKMEVSMDELSFACSWEKQPSFPEKLSCRLAGLLLEGCSFNNGKLVVNSPESPPIVKIPDCIVTWMKPGDAKKKFDTISVPLYYNETREKIIGSLDLPSFGEKGKWIQSGVALFLKT